MIRTRQYRTKKFRKQVQHAWKEQFWNVIEDNIDKPWDWSQLSANPNITFDIVLSNLDKHWDWVHLSINPNITVDNGEVAGQKDANFTVNITPRKTGDGLDFSWQPKQLSNEEMSSVEIALKEACKEIGTFEKEKPEPIKEKKKEKISEKENYLVKQLMKTP